MKLIIFLLIFSFSFTICAQNISANELLERAIEYHDPNNQWETFNSEFTVVMTTPNSPKRTSVISINLPKDYFSVTATKDTVNTTYTLDRKKCTMIYNETVLDSISAIDKKMSCDRAILYKNYYSYLYGLPMKLKDPGTKLNENVENRTFKGKEYLVLKVTYDETVGSDIWYFYFNPKTYAMEVYQFFKTDDKGNENRGSGEYILLSEEATIKGIKMPKIRAWYYNKDEKYLGTDTLLEN